MNDNLCESCAHWRVRGFSSSPFCYCDAHAIGDDSYRSVRVGCEQYLPMNNDNKGA